MANKIWVVCRECGEESGVEKANLPSLKTTPKMGSSKAGGKISFCPLAGRVGQRKGQIMNTRYAKICNFFNIPAHICRHDATETSTPSASTAQGR